MRFTYDDRRPHHLLDRPQQHHLHLHLRRTRTESSAPKAPTATSPAPSPTTTPLAPPPSPTPSATPTATNTTTPTASSAKPNPLGAAPGNNGTDDHRDALSLTRSVTPRRYRYDDNGRPASSARTGMSTRTEYNGLGLPTSSRARRRICEPGVRRARQPHRGHRPGRSHHPLHLQQGGTPALGHRRARPHHARPLRPGRTARRDHRPARARPPATTATPSAGPSPSPTRSGAHHPPGVDRRRQAHPPHRPRRHQRVLDVRRRGQLLTAHRRPGRRSPASSTPTSTCSRPAPARTARATRSRTTPNSRLTQVTNPQGLTWTYAYDPAGRLISRDGLRRPHPHLRVRRGGPTALAAPTRWARRSASSATHSAGSSRKDAAGQVTTLHLRPGRPTGHGDHRPRRDARCSDTTSAGRLLSETVNGRT